MANTSYVIASEQTLYDEGTGWLKASVRAFPITTGDLIDTEWKAKIRIDFSLYRDTAYGEFYKYVVVHKKVGSSWVQIGNGYSVGIDMSGGQVWSTQYWPERRNANTTFTVTDADVGADFRLTVGHSADRPLAYMEFDIPNYVCGRKMSVNGGHCYIDKSTYTLKTPSTAGFRDANAQLRAGTQDTTTGNKTYDVVVYSGDVVTVSGNSTDTTAYSVDSSFDWNVSFTDSVLTGEVIRFPYSAVGRTLTWTTPANCTMVVKKNGETISTGQTVYIGDVISYTVTPNTGYKIGSMSPASPFTCSGTQNETITVVIEASGTVTVRYNNAWHKALIWVRSGDAWHHALAFVRNNNNWKHSI